MSSILTFENVSKNYGKLNALSNIQFEIPENSIFAILGPNGSGKSTLIRILAGLMESLFKLCKKKEAPILSKARFKFLGLNLDFSIEKIRKTLGYQPSWSFEEGMRQSLDSFQNYGNSTSASQKDGTTAHTA